MLFLNHQQGYPSKFLPHTRNRSHFAGQGAGIALVTDWRQGLCFQATTATSPIKLVKTGGILGIYSGLTWINLRYCNMCYPSHQGIVLDDWKMGLSQSHPQKSNVVITSCYYTVPIRIAISEDFSFRDKS